MADNVTLTSGTGVTVATDDDGTAQHQWVKIEVGGNGSFVPITTANGLPVQILSLPALAVGTNLSVTGLTSASVSITGLVLVSGTTIAITSLPALGAGSVSSISGLTSAQVSITGLVLVSGTTIAITSLPALGAGSAVTISNLNTTPLTASITSGVLVSVTSAGIFRITSLPDLGLNSAVQISDNAYRFNTLSTAALAGYWRMTGTYTSAATNSILRPLSASESAHHITDIIFSNGDTHGSFTLLESPSDAAVRPVLDRIILRDYGGAVMNFSRPLVLDTNAALLFTSRSATNHGITVIGYTR